jgi:hypothetical protein
MTPLMPGEEADRLAVWMDRLDTERRKDVEQALRSYEIGVAQYRHLVVLTAGIIAVVPAVLSQSKFQIDTSLMRWGALTLVGTIIAGVLIDGVSKYTFMALLLNLGTRHAHFAERIGKALANPDAIAGLADAYQQTEKDNEPMMRRWRWQIGGAVIGDVVFYGSFIVGLVLLIRSIYG